MIAYVDVWGSIGLYRDIWGLGSRVVPQVLVKKGPLGIHFLRRGS